MERLLDTNNDDGPIDPKDLSELAKSVGQAVGSREKLESIRREFEASKRRAADEAKKTADAGGDGVAVVNRVREILGIPLGDDPES